MNEKMDKPPAPEVTPALPAEPAALPPEPEIIAPADDKASSFGQAKAEEMKKNLHGIIDAMNHNASMLTRAAQYWNDLSIFYKIGGGFVLIAPTLFIGVFLNIGVLIATSIFTLIGYVASSILLDDHHASTNDTIKNLKAGTDGLVDVLSTVFTALDELHKKLTGEVDSFKEENEHLEVNVGNLGDEVNLLSGMNEQLGTALASFAETKNLVSLAAKQLELVTNARIEQQRLTQEQLDNTQKEFSACKDKLSEQVKALADEKAALAKTIQQLNTQVTTLSAQAHVFIDSMTLDDAKREAFYKKLDDFLTNQNQSVDKAFFRICETEKKFEELTEKHAKLNEDHGKLLTVFETQLKRNEEIMAKLEQTEQNRAAAVSKAETDLAALRIKYAELLQEYSTLMMNQNPANEAGSKMQYGSALAAFGVFPGVGPDAAALGAGLGYQSI